MRVLSGAALAGMLASASAANLTIERWRPNRSVGLLGFSMLSRDAGTGEYACDVHVLTMVGDAVDQRRTMTFGHELLHCFGMKHE